MSCFTGCVANNTCGSQSGSSVTYKNSKKWIFAPCANKDTEYLSDASDEDTPPKKTQREAALSSVSTTASSLDLTPGKNADPSHQLNDGPTSMYDPLDIDEDEDSTTGLQLNEKSNDAPELDEPEDTKEKAEEQYYITSPFEAFDNYLGIPKQVHATLARPEVPVLTKAVEVPASPPEDDTTNFNDNIASTLPVSMAQVTKPSAVQGEIGTPGSKDDFSLGMCETGQPVVQRRGIGEQDLVERNAEKAALIRAAAKALIPAVALIRLRAGAKYAAANHKSFVTHDGTETVPCLDKAVASKSGGNVIGE